uniref:Uncharacterized protein n=1 Tax=Anguilla anguilla TaxID=7936 RepID=A0A0E9RXU8_ANGAN
MDRYVKVSKYYKDN